MQQNRSIRYHSLITSSFYLEIDRPYYVIKKKQDYKITKSKTINKMHMWIDMFNFKLLMRAEARNKKFS